MGFDSFGEAAFESGIVKTMLKVTQDKRTDIGPALASYNALESMWHLMRTGNVEERCALLQELLAHNALEISFEVGFFVSNINFGRYTKAILESFESSIGDTSSFRRQSPPMPRFRKLSWRIFIKQASFGGHDENVRIYFGRARLLRGTVWR